VILESELDLAVSNLPVVAFLAGNLSAEALPGDAPPAEFNWRDYAAMLLDVAAEIEHSLMVQYLFAAYSLGGPQVPSELRGEVRAWQETILGVAKEEMGHLLTVQNLHTALGLPLHLDREDYPWGSDFYPFDFSLERLTLDTLSTYVCAESPSGWSGAEADEIRARAAREAHGEVNRVGALYEAIKRILADRSLIPDTAFDASTVPRQASWDEWGRGYTQGARGESSNVPGVPAPDLLILEVSSRDSALHALDEIGEQGEAPKQQSNSGEDSHFVRFLAIYRALRKLDPPVRDLVSRRMQTNPTAGSMTEPDACAWAHLFNLRYRMLLVNLAHAFELADLPGEGAAVNPRGALINRTFAEMYNLRAIAGVLVELHAQRSGPEGPRNAGPPFEMPYTLALPRGEHNRWILHRNLLEASAALVDALRPLVSTLGENYLTALSESDALALDQVERMLGDGGIKVAAGTGHGGFEA
jgi:hypothetical protein